MLISHNSVGDCQQKKNKQEDFCAGSGNSFNL